MLKKLREQTEIIIAINAGDIEKNKVRGDLGITYDMDLLRLVDAFTSTGLLVGSAVAIFVLAGLRDVVQFHRDANANNSIVSKFKRLRIPPLEFRDARKLPLHFKLIVNFHRAPRCPGPARGWTVRASE